MSKELKTYNVLKVFELILSIIFIIGAVALSLYFFYGAFKVLHGSNNLMNSENGYAVFTGIFGSVGGFLILSFASLLFILTIGLSVMLIMSYINREKEGKTYTITSIIFLVISAIYVAIISSLFFNS